MLERFLSEYGSPKVFMLLLSLMSRYHLLGIWPHLIPMRKILHFLGS